MNSFTDVIDALKTLLTTDPDLEAFAQATWGKSFTVLTSYRIRTEISLEDMPVIILTRPEVEKWFLTGARDAKHFVRMYLGFLQDDREVAVQQCIELEELIDDLLVKDVTVNGTTIDFIPVASANDEGRHHPEYFLVMDAQVLHRRAG